MADLNQIQLPNGGTYNFKDTTQARSDHRHYETDITPLIHKTYASTSYYASVADWENSTWYFMSVKPDSWYKPWTVRFKVHSFCPSYSAYESITYATISGRSDNYVYANWNERQNSAHNYTVIYPLKQAGFNAGYGHAIGISVLYADSYTNSAYYRTFEIDYFYCENCTVTLLDTPVKWSSWPGTGSTNYGSLNSMNATSRGLYESGDTDTTYILRRYYSSIKAGPNKIFPYTLIMPLPDGRWESIVTSNSTGTSKSRNTHGFRLGQIMYMSASSTYDENVVVGYNNVADAWGDLFDHRYSFNTANNSTYGLTANKPVYLVGTVNASDGLFYLDSTWWTQTLPSTADGKLYIYLGDAYDYYRMNLVVNKVIYRYVNGMIRVYGQDAGTVNGHTVAKDVPSNAVFTDNNTTYTLGTNGNNVTLTPSSGSAQSITTPYATTAGSVAEANLSWGGKNFSGNYGCIDAAMIDPLGANRFFGIKADAITIEYSRDTGATWTDYGAANWQKQALFVQGTSILIGKADSTNKATANGEKYQLRITIDTGVGSIYTVLNKIVIYISTNGSSACKVKIQKALQSTPTTFVDHTDFIDISGWSGYNVLNISGLTTYGNTASSQYGRVRFIFKANGGNTDYYGLTVQRIMGFGGVGWATPSTMAGTGHLYTVDQDLNASFPAQITATKFNGTATTATTANQLNGMTATSSQTWGNQTGTFVHGENDSTGGSWAFRRDNPSSGQVSMILDGTVYIKEGGVNVSDAIKSITRSGTTFTYTTLWGNSGTFTQQDNNTTYTFANGTNGFTVTPSGGSAQTVTVTPSIANNVTGSGTNGYIAKFNGGNTITNGPALGSSTTTFLRNDGQWATPATGSDVNVTQTATSTSANYEVLFSATADNTTRTEGARKNNNLTFNPSTGNLQATQLNGVAIGSSPKFTDNNTTYTFANGTNGFTVTPSGGSAQTITVTPSIANNVTGSGTSGYLTKFNGGNTITNGPQLGSDTTKFLRNDGTWAVPSSSGSSGNKIFITEPTPPYSVGDLWLIEDNNISVCVTARASGSFNSDDWGSAIETLSEEELQNAIASAIAGAVTVVTGNGESGGNIILKMNSDNVPYELLVTDTPTNILSNTARIYRWDANGLRYSSTGYNGTYTTLINSSGQIPAQYLTGAINAGLVAIQNFTASMIHGGVLSRGRANNQDGTIEVYDANGTLIAEVSNLGLKIYGQGSGTDRPYYLINTNGFVGYTKVNNVWNQTVKVAFDEFRMIKGYVRDELDIGSMIKIIPMTSGNNSGIAFVAST